jgi:penicillin-binding protein 1A
VTAPRNKVVLEGLPPPLDGWRWYAKWAAFFAIAVFNAGVMGFVGTYAFFAKGLPSIPSIDDYRPPVITETISADGQIAGEFFNERRKVVPYHRIPKKVIQAFIASEDQNYFSHGGVDWFGTLKAGMSTYVFRTRVRGGSTLTQQTAKAILISTEGFAQGSKRTLKRKVREFILARRLEKAFSKEQILWLYLNGVYLGHHSYGVQSAAENYYRKNVEDLTLPEAALIAGLPQAPTRYSPFVNPESARNRRKYVLRRMYEDGMITAEERTKAEAEEVKVYHVDDVFRETSPFYVEHVRRDVVERYGNERLLTHGLRVEMAMDLEKQRAAQEAMLRGLYEVDHRQGFYGPVTRVAGKELDALRAKLKKAWPKDSLALHDYAVGIVTEVADDKATVEVGEEMGLLPLAGMRWARKPNSEAYYPSALIPKITGVLAPGDVIVVRRVERKDLLDKDDPETMKAPDGPFLLSLEQEPKLQGALVSLDPWTGYVAAMIGGYDFEASEFNRAFQACRQPGSAFKPIVYSAAIEKLDYNPATLITDAPIVFRDEKEAVSWKPQNFSEEFKGEVTLREALINSMNIPAVKTAQAVGVRQVAEWAKHLGLNSPVKLELGSALGSSCCTLWELTNVYALLNRYGERRPSYFVRRVLDRDGRVLEDHSDWRDAWVPLSTRLASAVASLAVTRERAMDERSAYMTVHLLHEVVTSGTGAGAARLGKPAAGKTGTTNDSFDTWFMGFTRSLVTGVWMGYDHNEHPLGRYETGGRASLPIWLGYMQAALRGRPQGEFPVPKGIVTVKIDPQTGKPLPESDKKGVPEPFKEGSEPKENAPGKTRVEVQDLFNQ